MTDEELLKKAIRDYPVGTKYLSAYSGSESINTTNSFIIGDDSISIDGFDVYFNGKWAKIINSPKQNENLIYY